MELGFPRSVTIYGTGLIGGSLSLALKKRNPETRIHGVDRPEVLDRAQKLGLIDNRGPAKSDLTVLATPVGQILDLLEEFQPDAGLILDVGSTKSEICQKADQRQLPFIGGHPMAGTERSGPEAASQDLFVGATFFLCPIRTTPAGATAAVTQVLTDIGAAPAVVHSEQHDKIVAQISHLPQLLSSLLADCCADNLRFAGPGVKSMTRLASSPFHVWRDIFETSGYLPHELQAFVQRLQTVLNALEARDFKSIESIFERGNKSASGGA